MSTDPAELSRQLDARTRAAELAERRLAEARADARALAQSNDRLNVMLRQARDAIAEQQKALDAASGTPRPFGWLVRHAGDGLADVHTGGRLVRVPLPPDAAGLQPGTFVLLGEALDVVAAVEPPTSGEVVRVRQALGDASALVAGASDEEQVVTLASGVGPVEVGESLVADRRAGVAFARVERSEVEELTLDEVPDVSWADIGGLGAQIEQIREAVELPFRHGELFATYRLAAPKGVLLYGPPGCGKTMIAKAVANAAGSHFLNVKGPELLNKYVGETERQIRAVFARAREVATSGRPVIVFFDEMDALFRTRGTGVSSDVESTIVPQLLSEIDGVESLRNVIIIGASNREDLIDPAILRPGRLDVKIRLDRPTQAGAAEILRRHLEPDVPLDAGDAPGLDAGELRDRLVDAAVELLYARVPANEFVEVTYATGQRETLYVGDFASGAMLASVVGRAKKEAVKDVLAGGRPGLRRVHIERAHAAEVAENEDLANSTNPEDWARVSGRRGERIVFLRTLHGGRALPLG